jgi:hypothetical protein
MVQPLQVGGADLQDLTREPINSQSGNATPSSGCWRYAVAYGHYETSDLESHNVVSNIPP